MKQHYSRDQVIDCSLRHSVREGAAYAVMSGSAETYFSAFAVYLKASTAQIGFLVSVPALLASFAQLLSAWLGHVFGKRKAIILTGATLIGVFVGALLGGYIGTVLPDTYMLFGHEITLVSQLYNIFILSFICRLVTSLLLIPRLKEIRRVKPVSVRRLVFRVVRLNPLSGLNFEVISSRKKSP